MLRQRFCASQAINWHCGHPTLFFCSLFHKTSCLAHPHTELWFSCPQGCNTLLRHVQKKEQLVQSWLSHPFICVSGFVLFLPLWRGSLSHRGWWHQARAVFQTNIPTLGSGKGCQVDSELFCPSFWHHSLKISMEVFCWITLQVLNALYNMKFPSVQLQISRPLLNAMEIFYFFSPGVVKSIIFIAN